MKKTDNIFSVSLNKKIYDKDVIRRSAQEFGKAAKVDISDKADIFYIKIRSKNGAEAEKIGREFCNYVLAGMKLKNG